MALVPRVAMVRRYIRVNAFRRGVLRRERLWMTIFVLGLLGRQVNKVLKRGEMPVLFSEKLEPGQRFLITHIDTPRGRRRG